MSLQNNDTTLASSGGIEIQSVTTPVESDTLARRSENWNVRSTGAGEQPNRKQQSKQMNHNDRSILQQKVNVDSTMFRVMSIV